MLILTYLYLIRNQNFWIKIGDPIGHCKFILNDS